VTSYAFFTITSPALLIKRILSPRSTPRLFLTSTGMVTCPLDVSFATSKTPSGCDSLTATLAFKHSAQGKNDWDKSYLLFLTSKELKTQ